MSARLITQLVTAFIFGILSAFYETVIYLIIWIFILMIQGIFLIINYGKKVFAVIFIRAILSLLSFYIGQVQCYDNIQLTKQNDAISDNYKQISVSGQIYQKENKDQQFIYYLRNTSIHLNGGIHPSNLILIYSDDEEYSIGNSIFATGEIIPFSIARNEGNFDEKKYNLTKNIGFKVKASKIDVTDGQSNNFYMLLSKFKLKLNNVYKALLPEKEAGVIASIVLNEKSLLSEEVKSLYQRSGISHILAISGLHISMIGLGVYELLKILKQYHFTAGIAASFVVISFSIMTGLQTSTYRATIMFLILIIGKIWGLSYDGITALSISALIQIWENTMIIFSASFLLSYSAVLGAFIVFPYINIKDKENNTSNKYIKLIKSIKTALIFSISIQICTLPISLYYFYEYSKYSIFVNLICLPFMGILLFLSIAGGLTGVIGFPLSRFIFAPCIFILNFYEKVCNFFLTLPFSLTITGRPSHTSIIIFYIIMTGLIIYAKQNRSKKVWIFIIVTFSIFTIQKKTTFLEISVLDVGQGDGIFIQTERGANYFIDGGSNNIKSLGKYRLLPFLKSKGIKKLDGWFLTHMDQDHYSGMMELIENGYPISNIILPRGIVKDESYEKFIQATDQAGIKKIFLDELDTISKDELKFTCLHPKGNETNTDKNSASLVLMITHRNFQALFTGDIGQEEEKILVEKYNLKQIDFYKAGHHGSAYSNSELFLDKIKPQITAISCSEKNNYGHPSEISIRNITNSGSKLYITKDVGQIKIILNDNKIVVDTYI